MQPSKTKNSFDNILKIVFETSPDMVVLLDKDGRILDCNFRYADTFGYQKKELIGKNGPIDMVTEKDRQRAIAAMSELVSNGLKLGVPIEVVRKDGSIVPSVWSGAALKDQQNHLQGYLVTGKDLLEIENLKKKIQKSDEKSRQEKMTLLGELTSRVAHDIRNPISNISMSINLIKQSNPDSKISDDSIKEKLEIITKNISRISHQINNVLDFIRIRPLVKEKIGLTSCFTAAIDCVSIPKNVQVKVSDSDLEIFADPNQIQVVFVNLIVNSIQAIGENKGTIMVRFKEESEHVVIEIEDSGKGIPDGILSSLFDMMITTKQTGTGLGLVSCKNIIQNHGGIIYAKNNPTTFTIKLPKQ